MIRRLALSCIVLTAVVILAIAGCSKNQAAERFTPPPTPIEMAKVKVGKVTDQFDAVGTIEAINSITVVSEIDALVRDLPFKEGAPIEQGGLIAQLDDVQLKAELNRASAIRDQKKATFDRISSLAQKGAIAPQELDNATADLKVAEAELAMIEARLSKTRITAPFAGVIGARRVSPGAFLRAGTPITDLAELSELKITFSAPEKYYPLLKRGAEVTVSTTAYPDYDLKGTIQVIDPVVDQSTRSAQIVAHVANPDLKFRPGMSANVSAILGERDSALVIPNEAVFGEGNQTLVYVIKSDSSVTRTAVTLGTREAETVEVLSGLQPGDSIVRTGYQKLYEGAKVMPITQQAAAPAAATAGGNK